MRKLLRILAHCVLVSLSTVSLCAQLSDVGTLGSISLSKDFNRYMGATIEQELRFDQLSTSLNRSATSIGAEISMIRRILRAEFGYDLLYRKNKDTSYEFRHRSSIGLLAQYKFNRLNYRLRTRMQATFRDENRGDYRYNPVYVWRNRFELRYDVFGSPFTPYLYGEMFCPVNTSYGLFMDGYRISFGTKYKASKRSDFDLQLRFDQEIQQPDQENILYCCVGWNYKL
ncbi:MAG: DUF2490 domain-containing protein [Paludibacter sp.]|nr:DUF2490 domain-containing protein [Paludibacter sp.]